MPSDLTSYLAERYLVADPKPTKKRKRKQPAADSGLLIVDDDESGWTRPRGGDDDEEMEGMPTTVAGTSAEFRKAKKSGWKTLGGGGGGITTGASGDRRAEEGGDGQAQPQDEAARQADAILASAAAETAAAGNTDDAPVMMSDGTHAGLQTAATVSAQLEARRKRERAEFEAQGNTGKESQTVYRDATGRRVDLEWKRAEARREAAEAAERETAAREALKGGVQVEQARRRREELEDAKTMSLARHADDAEMNDEMRGRARWGDTMAEFVSSKDGGGRAGAAGGGKKIKGRPIYQGAWAPNRYGIRPGYRWDGVDRGNGFEAERFKALNRRERNKGLEYSWQMDE
jgi:pre-mRNA-splicing factor CWC26